MANQRGSQAVAILHPDRPHWQAVQEVSAG
jgi:hypothetical protein